MTGRVSTHKEPGVLQDTALLKMAARFLVCFAAMFSAIVLLSARTRLIGDLQAVTASAATILINVSGVAATRADTLINVPGRQLAIGADCTGLTIAAMFVSLVAAYPVKWSSRVIGAFMGVAAIALANLVRLVAIAHVSLAPDWIFYGLHDFLFQVGMVGVAIAAWAYWLGFARVREP